MRWWWCYHAYKDTNSSPSRHHYAIHFGEVGLTHHEVHPDGGVSERIGTQLILKEDLVVGCQLQVVVLVHGRMRSSLPEDVEVAHHNPIAHLDVEHTLPGGIEVELL